MRRKILYYFPVEGAKNKAGNGNLTFDWFKKHFKLPIKHKYYTEMSNYSEEGYEFSYPPFRSKIAFTNHQLIWQGRVEDMIIEKHADEHEGVDETCHILLQGIK